MTYPDDLDNLFDPSSTTPLNNTPKAHSDWHTDANTAIEALEAKVGADSSAVETSHDYKLSGITGSDKAASLTDVADAKTEILLEVYPIGSVYTSIVSTNPGTLFGGTWSAFGAGKVLVGLDSEDADFDTAEETGGSKTMAHTHTTADHTHTTADHTHTINHTHEVISGDGVQGAEGTVRAYDYSGNSSGASAGNTTSGASTGNTTSAASNTNNLQPYLVVYFFKRTA